MMRIDLGRVQIDSADFDLYSWHSLSSLLVTTTITAITIASSASGSHFASAAFGFK